MPSQIVETVQIDNNNNNNKTSKVRITGPFVRIHLWPTDSPHKGSVTQKALLCCHDFIMLIW